MGKENALLGFFPLCFYSIAKKQYAVHRNLDIVCREGGITIWRTEEKQQPNAIFRVIDSDSLFVS